MSEKIVLYISTSIFIVVFLSLSVIFYYNISNVPMITAINSVYLYPHSLFGFISYSSLMASFCICFLSTFFNINLSRNINIFLLISLVSLAVCIITGSKWAAVVWGHSWSWKLHDTIFIISRNWNGDIITTFSKLIGHNKWNPKQVFTLILLISIILLYILIILVQILSNIQFNQNIILILKLLSLGICVLQGVIIWQALFAPGLVAGLHSSFAHAYLFHL